MTSRSRAAQEIISNDLVGNDLSGVTFVRDYIQLQFNPPPRLNVYTPLTVSVGGQYTTQDKEHLANALIGQINKVVAEVLVAPNHCSLRFTDGSAIAISLRSEDYVGPEAVEYFGRSGERVVL